MMQLLGLTRADKVPVMEKIRVGLSRKRPGANPPGNSTVLVTGIGALASPTVKHPVGRVRV